jgi:hypothetical protein
MKRKHECGGTATPNYPIDKPCVWIEGLQNFRETTLKSAPTEITVARFEFPAEKILALFKGGNAKVERDFKIRVKDGVHRLHWTYGRSGLDATSVANTEAVRPPLDVDVPKLKTKSNPTKLVIEFTRHGATRPYFMQNAWFE